MTKPATNVVDQPDRKVEAKGYRVRRGLGVTRRNTRAFWRRRPKTGRKLR